MIPLVVEMTTSQAIVVGIAFLVVGALIQYFCQLELDDYRDVREQEAEADRDAILDVVHPQRAPRSPSTGRWIAPRGGWAPRVPAQRRSPEDGAR